MDSAAQNAQNELGNAFNDLRLVGQLLVLYLQTQALRETYHDGCQVQRQRCFQNQDDDDTKEMSPEGQHPFWAMFLVLWTISEGLFCSRKNL